MEYKIKTIKYLIQSLLIIFIVPFIFFSCTFKEEKKIDTTGIVGDYSYKRSKSMGGVEITGEWKLAIVQNGEGDYSYSYTYSVTDEMYSNIPKVMEVSKGKLGKITPYLDGFKWYFTGDLSNSFIAVPKEGFISAPQILNFTSGSGDYKYFERIISSNPIQESNFQTNLDTSHIDFKNENFNPTKFILERKSSINNLLSKYNGDYYEICVLDNTKLLSSIKSDNNFDKINQFSNTDINFVDFINALNEGVPIYEVFVIRKQTTIYRVGNVKSYVNGYAILWELVFYSTKGFIEIPYEEMKNYKPLLNAFNILTVFKRSSVKAKDVSENIIEIPDKNNMLLWNEIPISKSKWFGRISGNWNHGIEDEPEQEINQDNNTNEEKENTLGIYETKASKEHYVYFYSEPNELTKRKAHFDSQEKVTIQKIENGFGYVEYTNSMGQKSIGWLAMSDLILSR